MTSAYWDRVVAESVREIRAGRTPNPDVLCNSRVKFGAFLDHLDQQLLAANGDNGSSSSSSSSISSSVTPAPAQDAAAAVGSPAAEGQGLVQWPWERQGFDRVASGHYARVARRHRAAAAAAASAGPAPVAPTGGKEQEGEVGAYLELTPDAVKDQTYFLAHLRPSQLSRAMFPLGGLTKQQVCARPSCPSVFASASACRPRLCSARLACWVKSGVAVGGGGCAGAGAGGGGGAGHAGAQGQPGHLLPGQGALRGRGHAWQRGAALRRQGQGGGAG